MVKLLTHAGRCTGRYLTLAALTTTLVACGGSGSGDSTGVDGQDFDGDGILNSEDPDADGDGIPNVDDDFTDLDSDGFDDVIGAQDLDGDGIANKDDPDADNDGLLDASLDDKFVDLDGDGFDDISGLTEITANFPAITPETPCGGESGTDAYSTNANWNDNCLIKRTSVGGQFADSLYAVGVQRVVFCSNFTSSPTATAANTYADYADGEFGPDSETDLKLFQSSEPNPISDDGQVGPQTWAKLQAAITRLTPGTIGEDAAGNTTVGPDVYGFTEGRCADIPLFHQSGTFDTATQSVVMGGWRLVRNSPSNNTIPFSIDPPFGRLND